MYLIKAWLLNFIYLAIYLVMIPFILGRKIRSGRPLGSFSQRFLGLAPRGEATGRCIWFHAVSVGEVNLLAPLLDRLRKQDPDCRFVISSTTATGRQLAREKYPQIESFFFPIDFSWAIRNALRRVSPTLIVLAELEVWPNLTGMASRQQIPVVIVNGRLGQNSFRGYRRMRWLLKPAFSRLGLVAAQSREYADRFVQLGCPAERVRVSGSMKFDGALAAVDRGLGQRLAGSIGLEPDDVLWVAGSTQQPEEVMAARVWRDLARRFPQLRLVIVPRHPHRGAAIQGQLASLGIDAVLRSRHGDAPVARDQVLVSDTIGELTTWWSLTSIAFVGGSFGNRGGQNMIEPAAAGAAVCLGPNTWNFRQVVELLKAHDVVSEVASPRELREFVERCLTRPQWASRRGSAARTVVESQQGSVERTCEILATRPDSPPRPASRSRQNAA